MAINLKIITKFLKVFLFFKGISHPKVNFNIHEVLGSWGFENCHSFSGQRGTVSFPNSAYLCFKRIPLMAHCSSFPWACKHMNVGKKKKSCRMDFMTQAKGNLWPSGKVGQLGWGQLSGKCVWIPESEIPDLDPKFDTFIALIHWALTITWEKFCFPIGCTRENYSSPPECLLYFHTEYFISDASGHQMCGSFPPHQSILWHQLVVLQFNSILTISTWM